MSDLEDKILGKEKRNTSKAKPQNIFSAENVWKISRPKCGITLTNGVIASEMFSPEGKAKALKGNKKIVDSNCVFERLK